MGWQQRAEERRYHCGVAGLAFVLCKKKIAKFGLMSFQTSPGTSWEMGRFPPAVFFFFFSTASFPFLLDVLRMISWRFFLPDFFFFLFGAVLWPFPLCPGRGEGFLCPAGHSWKKPRNAGAAPPQLPVRQPDFSSPQNKAPDCSWKNGKESVTEQPEPSREGVSAPTASHRGHPLPALTPILGGSDPAPWIHLMSGNPGVSHVSRFW